MSISEADIAHVKQSISFAAYVRARGIELKRKGKQLLGHCPFHNDKTPSFVVDEAKGLWNCLGKCAEGGDLYKFVMKADRLSFPAAHKKLLAETGAEKPPDKPKAKPEKVKAPARTEIKEKAELTKVELDWLERVTTHYHGCLLRNEKAVAYLNKRGIVATEAITTFRLGYADGSLPEKLNEEGRATLQRLGVLNEKGNETMFGSVIFPLVDPHSKQTVNFYARHLSRRQHLYLPGERRGLFNPNGATNADELIITESIIDALALWSLGFRSIIPAYGTNGLTREIVNHLSENRIKKVVLLLDADEAGREAAAMMTAKLAELGIESRSVELPAKDAAEFVAGGWYGGANHQTSDGRAKRINRNDDAD